MPRTGGSGSFSELTESAGGRDRPESGSVRVRRAQGRIVVDPLDTLLSSYDSRFRASHGPLRPEVSKVLFAFGQCIARRAEQTAAQLSERLPTVAHRHLVVSIPKKMGLRLRIQEDRRLFRRLARVITGVLRRHMSPTGCSPQMATSTPSSTGAPMNWPKPCVGLSCGRSFGGAS